MLKSAIVASGLALVNAGLSSMASAGVAYFLDPKRGERRRVRLWKRAQTLLDGAGELKDAAVKSLHRDARQLHRQVDRVAAWMEAPHLLPARRTPIGLPLVALGVGVSAGAGLMYLLDSQEGHGRRVLLRDRTLGLMARMLRHLRHPSADRDQAGRASI